MSTLGSWMSRQAPTRELLKSAAVFDEEAQVLHLEHSKPEQDENEDFPMGNTGVRLPAMARARRFFGWMSPRQDISNSRHSSNDSLQANDDKIDWAEKTSGRIQAKADNDVPMVDGPVQSDTENEQARIRCLALVAAVATWCLLQPFILFFVLAHFHNHHLYAYSGHVTLLLLVLSILIGVFMGPKAVQRVMRIAETEENPTRMRLKLYAIVVMMTAAVVLTLAPLLFDGDDPL